MEDFLPILIGIIWIAYTFYTKGRKKRTPNEAKPASQKSTPVESIIRELFGEETKTSADDHVFQAFDELEEEVEEFEEISVKQTPVPFLQHEIKEFVTEGGDALPDDFQDTMEIENNDNKDEIEEFNLRKAVIYSEILNAPYI